VDARARAVGNVELARHDDLHFVIIVGVN
jgi:hypothetical protein